MSVWFAVAGLKIIPSVCPAVIFVLSLHFLCLSECLYGLRCAGEAISLDIEVDLSDSVKLTYLRYPSPLK